MTEGVVDALREDARQTGQGRTMPRLGFLGVGWIGRNRMEALLGGNLAEATVIADPDAGARREARRLADEAIVAESPEALLEHADALDAVVIATPSAQHAQQAVAALERGLAVFCQKPLGRSAAEARRVVDAARAADRLLGVDMCYRHTRAGAAVADLVRGGSLGRIYAADLTFHNAYGPDKEWFYDPTRSGGGCVMDLGIHLIDLLMWTLGEWSIDHVHANLFQAGEAVAARGDAELPARAEDHAIATLQLASGVSARLACSWNLPAGRDAVIEVTFYGTDGAATLRNVDGSFYDFVAEHMVGTATERLIDPPDDWGGRAISAWARRLHEDPSYDERVEETVRVAAAIDAIYA